MRELKKILIVLLIALLMVGLSNATFATDDDNVTMIPDEGQNNATGNTNSLFNNANTNANTNRNANSTNTNITANTNSSQYNNTNLPDAGSTDEMTIIFIVAIFGISALYAYKKIKDYNIK